MYLRSLLVSMLVLVAITASAKQISYEQVVRSEYEFLTDSDLVYAKDPDLGKTAAEIIKNRGYPFEQHYTETEDGYIGYIARIPHGKNDYGSNMTRPAVLLQHGLLDSSDSWVMNDAENASAFILADLGYDVWMSNSRGNKYNRKHVTLDPDTDKFQFWNFSFEEMGKYDIIASIEYVRLRTGQAKIGYIGHSQGTTQFFTAISERYEFLKERISVMAAWGPVAKLEHCSSPIIVAMATSEPLLRLVKMLGLQEFLPANWATNKGMSTICRFFPFICDIAISLIMDGKPNENNPKRGPIMLEHFPSGASTKAMMHYGQVLKYKSFQRYDFGSDEENMEHYGTITPPEYDLTGVKDIPIGLFVGRDDRLATIEDVKWLKEQLKENVKVYKEYDYGHATFIIGRVVPHIWDTLDLFKKYYPSDKNF